MPRPPREARPSRFRLYRQAYGGGALALVVLIGALCAVAFGRLTFDYARSFERPTLRGLAAAPLLKRTAQYLEATAINALTRLPAAAKEPISTIDLIADPEQLSLLGPRSAKVNEVEINGHLRAGKRWVPVKISLRGDNIFQWGGELRSFKVKLGKGEMVFGQRDLNLINPKDLAAFSLPYGEYVGSRLGLLVPGTQPCRFLFNGENQGVYFCQQPLDEAWLRQQRRIPGNLYGGDYLVYGHGADVADAMRLWDMAGLWKQTAWVLDQGEGRGELGEFLGALREIAQAPADADPVPLRKRLERIANLDAFLGQWAVHAWTDSPHQDEYHNWRLYFDPSRGLLEPIVWDTLRSWEPRGAAALDSPLPRPHLALLRFPELNQRRYELLYQQLLLPELASQVSEKWAAQFMADTRGTLLSAVSVDRMVWSPGVLMWLTVGRFQALAAQDVEGPLIRKHAQALAAALGATRLEGVACMPQGHGLACRLALASHAGVRLAAAMVAGREVSLRRSAVAEPRFAVGEPGKGIDFYPQFATAPNPPLPGRFVAILTAAPQDFHIDLPGVDALVFVNSLTGTRTGVAVGVTASLPAQRATPPYSFRPGAAWGSAPPPVRLGPGEVDVSQTLLTAVGQALVVAPGTTLRMGPGASIVARGPLHLEGTPDRPIRVVPKQRGQRWGGILVLGDDAAGTRLAHCRITGGTKAEFARMTVTGMLQISHTHDVAVSDCDVSDNGVGDDTVHFLQVTGLRLERLNVHGGRMDCIDLDYVRGSLSDVRAEHCGNDGLDLMTSLVTVTGATLKGCGDKGASIGERSVVWFTRTNFVGNTIGIQAKDLSEAYLESSNRFEGNRSDVSAYEKSRYYGAGGCVVSALADDLATSMLNGSRFIQVHEMAPYRKTWQTPGKAGPCWSTP